MLPRGASPKIALSNKRGALGLTGGFGTMCLRGVLGGAVMSGVTDN
jgi:hypothetical protein